jgi:hypothetical protein
MKERKLNSQDETQVQASKGGCPWVIGRHSYGDGKKPATYTEFCNKVPAENSQFCPKHQLMDSLNPKKAEDFPIVKGYER